MEFFENARTVCLKGPHGKYLWAEEDQYKISQNRESKHEQALWRVEKVPDSKLIRLLSCYDTYLTASDSPLLLGMTGKKVIQTRLKHIDSSVEWEPVSERFLVKLKTCHGNFLRANNGLPPWRGSVTHDLPQRFQHHQEFLLWEVENVTVTNVIPVEVLHAEIPRAPQREAHEGWVPNAKIRHQPKREIHESRVPQADILNSPQREAHESWVPDSISHPKPTEGREIFYTVADENSEIKNIDEDGWSSFRFKGHSLKLLQERLQAETGIKEDIVLYARHPSSTKLYTLRLGLPPNKAAMHIVVVRKTSSLTRSLSPAPSL